MDKKFCTWDIICDNLIKNEMINVNSKKSADDKYFPARALLIFGRCYEMKNFKIPSRFMFSKSITKKCFNTSEGSKYLTIRKMMFT
jgi:hypothetical protein